MAVRYFDGVDDRIKANPGAVPKMNKDGTGATMFTLVKGFDVPFIQTGCVISAHGTGGVKAGMYWSSGSREPHWGLDDPAYDGTPPGEDYVPDVWMLLAGTRPPGSSKARIHMKPFGGSWSHEDCNETAARDANNNIDNFIFGSFTGSNGFNEMELATAAAWDSVLSDAQIESIGTAMSTAGVLALSPGACWDFNQASAATPITDLTGGGADQNSIVGTAAVADDPPGWTFGIAEVSSGGGKYRAMRGFG